MAWVFSQSTQFVAWMGALHLLFWLVSTFFGLRLLRAGFAPSGVKSLAGFHTWVVVFLLVALQMTTALRLIVGAADRLPPTENEFSVRHWVDCVGRGASMTQ